MVATMDSYHGIAMITAMIAAMITAMIAAMIAAMGLLLWLLSWIAAIGLRWIAAMDCCYELSM